MYSNIFSRIGFITFLVCNLLGGYVGTVTAQDQDEVTPQFLRAVQDGDLEELVGMMHPVLAEKIDPPILEAWLQAVSYRLGPVDSITPGTVIRTESHIESNSSVRFMKGSAKVALKSSQGALISFEVQSDQMSNWFLRPTSLDLYRERSEKFYTAWISEDYETCIGLLHPQIAKSMGVPELEQYREKLQSKISADSKLDFKIAKLSVLKDERLERVDLHYDLVGNEEKFEIIFAFRFRGMRGEIIGFQIR